MNEFFDSKYISGVMSLRKPQSEALEILEQILQNITLKKGESIENALNIIKQKYPICKDFEREFISLAFVLATGVGKTRLMGAFITLLYAKHKIKNFFVVAPNTTIFKKLKDDLGNPSSPKYVFKGLSCFAVSRPEVICEYDAMGLYKDNVKIYVFNIAKFNKESAKMRDLNEYLGQSFFEILSKLDDLVLIMDESHNYRADRGVASLNELNPLLGLELTATPYYNKGSKQVMFNNAVYEYPLSKSIKDGYTRTPYAITRQDISLYNFGDNDMDKMMINDGIICHEKIKTELEKYGANYNKRMVKPFAMIVCKDTAHATKIYEYVKSVEFKEGKYENKCLLMHSNQKQDEKEKSVKLLQSVENSDNPIEIIIHVDMLKEGWDVNNLYTIIPLRTASSKILREQMVGRGLRLPFGQRTDIKEIDAVMLTAHDKFDEILTEARSSDSIFNAENVIKADEVEKESFKIEQGKFNFADDDLSGYYNELNITQNTQNDNLIVQINEIISEKTTSTYLNKQDEKVCIEAIKQEISQDKDLAKRVNENLGAIFALVEKKVKKNYKKIESLFIPIPQIKIVDSGISEYRFNNFDLDTSALKYTPLQNNIVVQNLQDTSDQSIISGENINFNANEPKKTILHELRKNSEIDYEENSDLIFKLISQAVEFLQTKHGASDMKNIVMMNKIEIAGIIYKQMFKEPNFVKISGLIDEQIVSLNHQNLPTSYTGSRKSLFDGSELDTNAIYKGCKKSVFDIAKFDSKPELILARVIEYDKSVEKWLRPNANEFNLYYSGSKRYEPDFVVETNDMNYIVEVKGENMLEDADVLAKKERAVSYCKLASIYAVANGLKEWRYIFIPSGQISQSSTFENLAKRFLV